MLSSVLKSSVVGQYQSRGAWEHAGLTTSEIYEVLVACKVMSLLVVQGHRKGHSTFLLPLPAQTVDTQMSNLQ